MGGLLFSTMHFTSSASRVSYLRSASASSPSSFLWDLCNYFYFLNFILFYLFISCGWRGGRWRAGMTRLTRP